MEWEAKFDRIQQLLEGNEWERAFEGPLLAEQDGPP